MSLGGKLKEKGLYFFFQVCYNRDAFKQAAAQGMDTPTAS